MGRKVSKKVFRKGDLVKAYPPKDEFSSPPRGFYHFTEAEMEVRREEQRQAIRAGEIEWHDCAGEPRLVPKHAVQDLNPEFVYEVLRGRCRVERGYHMVPGQVKILDTETGRELYCEREDLYVVG